MELLCLLHVQRANSEAKKKLAEAASLKRARIGDETLTPDEKLNATSGIMYVKAVTFGPASIGGFVVAVPVCAECAGDTGGSLLTGQGMMG